MKNFLLRLSAFMALVVGFMAVMYAINTYFIQQNPYRLKAGVHRVIIGDSQPEYGLNPDHMAHSVNLCQPGEMPMLSYVKVRELIRHNPDIQTLVMGLAHHSISSFNDYKLEDKKWAGEMISRMYSIMHWQEMRQLPLNHERYLTTLMQHMMLYPQRVHQNYIGHFFDNKISRLAKAKVEDPFKRHFFVRENPAAVSPVMLNYIDSLCQLTAKHQIKIAFVGLPVHPQYHAVIPAPFRQSYDSLLQKLNTLPHVRALDFTSLPLPDSLFRDYDHINGKGAQYFTEFLSHRLDSLWPQGW